MLVGFFAKREFKITFICDEGNGNRTQVDTTAIVFDDVVDNFKLFLLGAGWSPALVERLQVVED